MKTKHHLQTRAASAGFSLAELMVVIVIIGLLGTVVVPNVLSRLSTSQVSTTAASINQIETAAELFRMDNNRWPETVEELVTKDDRGTSYLKGERAPTDAWNNEFVLEVDGSELLIWSMGQDGSEGGEGLDMDFNNRMIRNKEVK